MKWKQWSQKSLAATALIGSGIGLVSCGTSNTVDYLYLTSSKNNPGQINVYRVDSQSGALTQIPDSPYNAGRNPVSLVVDSTGQNLYVANLDDNSIIQYAIGTDAKLYGQHTINPPGSEPVSLSIHSYLDKSGNVVANFLFVVENLQASFTDVNSGPGGALFVYKLGMDGTLGATPVTQTVNGVSQNFLPLGKSPSAVNVTNDGLHIYASDILATGQSSPGCIAGQGGIQGYNMQPDPSLSTAANFVGSGVLQSVAGSPFCAGATPSALASHPFSTFLYATDSSQNQVITYDINTTTSPGSLSSLATNSLTTTGTAPDGIVVEPRGQYVYVANRLGGVNSYAVNQITGGLSALSPSGTVGTQGQPGCIIVEPALARFVYTANFLDGTVNGFVLDPNTGGLSATQGTYYNGSGLAHCVAATPHGNHPIIHVQNTAG